MDVGLNDKVLHLGKRMKIDLLCTALRVINYSL